MVVCNVVAVGFALRPGVRFVIQPTVVFDGKEQITCNINQPLPAVSPGIFGVSPASHHSYKEPPPSLAADIRRCCYGHKEAA